MSLLYRNADACRRWLWHIILFKCSTMFLYVHCIALPIFLHSSTTGKWAVKMGYYSFISLPFYEAFARFFVRFSYLRYSSPEDYYNCAVRRTQYAPLNGIDFKKWLFTILHLLHWALSTVKLHGSSQECVIIWLAYVRMWRLNYKLHKAYWQIAARM